MYLQSYAAEQSLEYIRRNTAKQLQLAFQRYNPEFTEEDFYQVDIGTSGIMLGYTLRPCSGDFTLSQKIGRYLEMSLGALNVPAEERAAVIASIQQQDLRTIAKGVIARLFEALADTFDFELEAQMFGEER